MLCITYSGHAQNVRAKIDSLNRVSFEGLFVNLKKAASDAAWAARLSQEAGYQKGLGRSFTRLGIYYDLEGKPDSAALFLNLAINVLEKEKDTAELSRAYNNLALVHYTRYDYDKALLYFKKSIEQDRLAGDIRGMAGGLQNIGILYTYKDSLETAEKIYREAEQIYRSLNDSANLPMVFSNQAKVAVLRNDYGRALGLLRDAEKMLPEKDNDESRTTIWISLSNALSQLGRADEALDYARRALALSQKIHSKYREQFAYDQLQEVYKAKGDYRNAYTYLAASERLGDTLYDTETNHSISEMQAKFDMAHKDEDLRRVTLEKEAATNRSKAKENSRNFALALAAIVVVISVFVFSAWRSGKKITRLLEEKNALAVTHLEQKEMLIAEIHHRIKNNLQLISDLLDFQARSVKDEQAIKSLEDSKNRVVSMAALHQFLYTSGDYKNIDMTLYLNELASKLLLSYASERSDIRVKVEADDTRLDIDTAIPIGLIVNELVTNAYKHAFAENESGEIFIQLKKISNDTITLRITDNGKGIPDPTHTLSSFGTRIITSLCRQLRADWSIDNSSGTSHTLHIKKFKNA